MKRWMIVYEDEDTEVINATSIDTVFYCDILSQSIDNIRAIIKM